MIVPRAALVEVLVRLRVDGHRLATLIERYGQRRQLDAVLGDLVPVRVRRRVGLVLVGIRHANRVNRGFTLDALGHDEDRVHVLIAVEIHAVVDLGVVHDLLAELLDDLLLERLRLRLLVRGNFAEDFLQHVGEYRRVQLVGQVHAGRYPLPRDAHDLPGGPLRSPLRHGVRRLLLRRAADPHPDDEDADQSQYPPDG
ncbi:hypothetical protein CMK11_21570 [Candidatus Poribacteria bacterium]|nr:hypothetical protein [Candidatus Poribacteria bacterium]